MCASAVLYGISSHEPTVDVYTHTVLVLSINILLKKYRYCWGIIGVQLYIFIYLIAIGAWAQF